MNNHQSTNNNPVLCFIRGLPGSGKSYFANNLFKSIDTDQKILLDPDSTDYESEEYKKHVVQQTNEGVDPKLFPYRFLRAQAYEAIERRKIILWNQPLSNLEILQKVITRLEEHAQENGVLLQIMFIEVEIDPEIARQRIVERKNNGGHGPSNDVFTRFVNDYGSIKHLGYETISIDGLRESDLYIPKVLEIVQKLQKVT